jgi:hypothetical protein
MRRQIEALFAIALSILIAGCAPNAASWQQWLGLAEPPATPNQQSESSTEPAPAIESPPAQQSSTPHAEHEPVRRETPSEARRTHTAVQPTPVVTLGDSDNARTSAQHSIDAVSATLTRVDRSALQPRDLTVYDQANSFIDAARKAMASEDYAAASGFAHKASALTAKLAPASAVP